MSGVGRWILGPLTGLLVVGCTVWLAPGAAAEELAPQLRRPMALELSADQQWLYTANYRSGSVSIVDLDRHQTVGQQQVGRQLADLAAVPGTGQMVAVDEAAHELLLLDVDGRQVAVRQRLTVSPYPVSVVVSSDGRHCYVASLWSRRLTLVELPGPEPAEAHIRWVVDLPFAPREQLLVRDDSRLVVADAFGGRLGVVAPADGTLQGVQEIPGHNIRGLGVSIDGRMLIVSHQMLNELAHTVRNDVHWGLLMSNDLRWLRLDSVLSGASNLYTGAHMHPLGEAGNGTADPAGLAVAPDGTVVVALGGAGQVALGQEKDFSLQRVRVGRRPTAVVISRDGRRAYVANTFADSVSVVELDERQMEAEISLGPQTELTLVDQGELLFYDADLSHDRWMSCHSCHTDGHTNGLLNDNFSDASFGTPKRVLSLLGVAGTAPFAWDGGVPDLPAQIRNSVLQTMQNSRPPTDHQVTALAAYLETLPLPPPIDQVRGVQDDQAVARGRDVFHTQDCNRCHAPPAYTSPRTYNVGLEDELGNHHFNPPSLRGAGQRGPYFHDNRAPTLEEVFQTHGHQLKDPLTNQQLQDLVAFLRSL